MPESKDKPDNSKHIFELRRTQIREENHKFKTAFFCYHDNIHNKMVTIVLPHF